MKRAILKITTYTLLAAAMVGAPAWLRAADADTNAPATSAASGPTKFYGKVSAVDATAKTFTVGDDTYAIVGESELTKNGKAATLADVVVGDPARGTYTKGSDGKLDVTKVRFGKAGKGGGKSGKKKKDTSETDTNTPAASPQN
jgi:hypothetical protein